MSGPFVHAMKTEATNASGSPTVREVKRAWEAPSIESLAVASTQINGAGYASEYRTNGCPADAFSRATEICAS